MRFSKSRVSSSSSSSSPSSWPSLAAVAAKVKKKGTPAKGKAGAKDADRDKACLHDILLRCRRVVVIGVQGWFPGPMIRSVLGEVSVFFFSLYFLILWLIGLLIIICATCLNE